jgi:predicted DNA-binding transcriptional regulator YafY
MKMKRSKSQFARLMALDEQIRGGRHPNALTFAAAWEVSQKTIQRDIEFLRDSLGAPIEYDKTKQGYYYTHSNWFLPSVNMTESDLRTLLVAASSVQQYQGTPVAKDLERLFGKLAEALPRVTTLNAALILSRFSFTSPPAKPVEAKVWSVLVESLLCQRSVQIQYRSGGVSQVTDRVIDPYHMANLQGEWYLFAFCHTKKKVLQFGVPYILEASLTSKTYSIPASFDAQKMLAQTFRRFALGDGAKTIRLRFDKEVAQRVSASPWHPSQTTKQLRSGEVELSFQAAGLFEVSRWVLAWGHNVRVLAPPELKTMVEGEIKLMARSLGGHQKGS